MNEEELKNAALNRFYRYTDYTDIRQGTEPYVDICEVGGKRYVALFNHKGLLAAYPIEGDVLGRVVMSEKTLVLIR